MERKFLSVNVYLVLEDATSSNIDINVKQYKTKESEHYETGYKSLS